MKVVVGPLRNGPRRKTSYAICIIFQQKQNFEATTALFIALMMVMMTRGILTLKGTRSGNDFREGETEREITENDKNVEHERWLQDKEEQMNAL